MANSSDMFELLPLYLSLVYGNFPKDASSNNRPATTLKHWWRSVLLYWSLLVVIRELHKLLVYQLKYMVIDIFIDVKQVECVIWNWESDALYYDQYFFINGNNAVELNLPQSMKIHLVVNISWVKLYKERLPGQPLQKPGPMTVTEDCDIEYEVDYIVDSH